jgi:DNA-binding transcriptional MerR regulator
VTDIDGAVTVAEGAKSEDECEHVGGQEGMTTDELERRAGMTTRNVRSYQTRGILPPPHMIGRVGHHGESHPARLKSTARLQERGFSLAAICAPLSAWEEGRTLQDVLDFEEISLGSR